MPVGQYTPEFTTGESKLKSRVRLWNNSLISSEFENPQYAGMIGRPKAICRSILLVLCTDDFGFGLFE